MDERVKEYLKQKYADQLENINTAQAFANLGDVISGQRVGSQVPFFERQKQLAGAQTLGEIERQDEMDLRRQMAQENLDFKKMQLEQAAEQARNNAEMRKALFSQKQQGIAAKQLQPKDISTKLTKLSSGDKSRLDNAMMALKALDEMGQALDAGENTFSLVGDNPYTAAERRATEAYGRMQSGGAINKDEEKRFSKTLPQYTENPQIQRQKLITQKNEMISRLKTLGFSPQDLGYEPKEFSYGKSEKQKQERSEIGRQYSPSRNQTKITYSDGTEEVVNGRQSK